MTENGPHLIPPLSQKFLENMVLFQSPYINLKVASVFNEIFWSSTINSMQSGSVGEVGLISHYKFTCFQSFMGQKLFYLELLTI